LTFKLDLDNVKMKQLRAKCLGQRWFLSKVIVCTHGYRHTHIHTQRTDCSTWTTKEMEWGERDGMFEVFTMSVSYDHLL